MQIQKYLNWLDQNTPMILMISAGLSFLAVWTFKFKFYTDLLNSQFDGWILMLFAGMIGLIAEGTRFALLISTVTDFGSNNRIGGWLGLIGSVGFVGFEIWESTHVAAMYDQAELIAVLIKFLVIVGLALEFRLVLNLLDNVNNQSGIGTGMPIRRSRKKDGVSLDFN